MEKKEFFVIYKDVGDLLKEDWEGFSEKFPKIMIPKSVYDRLIEHLDEYNRMEKETNAYLYGVFVKTKDRVLGIVYDVLLPSHVDSTKTRLRRALFPKNLTDIYREMLKILEKILGNERTKKAFDEDSLRFFIILCHNHPSKTLTLSWADRHVAYSLREYSGGLAIIGVYNGERLVIYGKIKNDKSPFYPLNYKIENKNPPLIILVECLKKYFTKSEDYPHEYVQKSFGKILNRERPLIFNAVLLNMWYFRGMH